MTASVCSRKQKEKKSVAVVIALAANHRRYSEVSASCPVNFVAFFVTYYSISPYIRNSAQMQSARVLRDFSQRNCSLHEPCEICRTPIAVCTSPARFVAAQMWSARNLRDSSQPNCSLHESCEICRSPIAVCTSPARFVAAQLQPARVRRDSSQPNCSLRTQ